MTVFPMFAHFLGSQTVRFPPFSFAKFDCLEYVDRNIAAGNILYIKCIYNIYYTKYIYSLIHA